MTEQLAFNYEAPQQRLIQLWTPNEIYDNIETMEIAALSEDRRVERKGPNIKPYDLAEYLSMWSNTQPHGGVILLGVRDKGSVVGCKALAQNRLNDLESLSSLCPDARWASKRVSVINIEGEKDFIVVYRVEFREDKVVEMPNGDAFIREGDKKLQISEILKRELRISRGEIHYELETVSLKYPEDFDLESIDRFCRAFFVNRRFKIDKNREELLELGKLGKRIGAGFQPNLACSLLFAHDPREIIPGARIRIIKYDGIEEKHGNEMNVVYSTFVDGNISNIIFEAKSVISSQLRSFQRLTGSGRLLVSPEYPEEAWLEAVVNAVAHRSYNMKTQNVFIKIFDDRFVVESPGGFVPPTTPDSIYEAHNPRNPYLMEAMLHLELTFCGHEGTRRMKHAMEVAKLPEPRFRQIQAHSYQVHVTLENDINLRRNIVSKDVFSKIPEEILTSLSHDERAIVNFLIVRNEINITSASLATGKSWPTASRLIASLVEKGIVEERTKRGRKRDSTKVYRLRGQ